MDSGVAFVENSWKHGPVELLFVAVLASVEV